MGYSKTVVVLLMVALISSSGCGRREKTEGKIVLRFMRFTSVEVNPIYEKIVADFEKNHPSIKIKEEIGVRQEQLQTQMAGNSAPDVIHFANKSLADFGTRGTLLDLREYIKRDNYNIEDIYPQAFKEGSVPSGAIYGMPTTGGPEVLYYNKDLFDKAGLNYPDENWTWDDYLEAAKALTKDINQDGRIDQYGTTVGVSGWCGSLPWLWAAGGDLMNDDVSKCIVNSPEAQTAIQFLVYLDKHKAAVKSSSATEMGGGREMFMTGKLGMFIYLPWNTLNHLAKCKSLRWDMALVPKGPKGRFPRYTGECFSIWIGSKHKEESWEFIKYLCSKEVSILFAKSNWMPARKSVAESAYFIKEGTPYHEEIYIESMKYARALSSIPYLGGQGGRMAGIWETEITLTLLEKQTVAKALERIEKQVNAVLDEERIR
jgi:multiple sugar transport system substrate-binding protein